jgi:hypothetical protein
MSSQYIIPSKQLHSQHDLDAKWINSEAYKKLLTFVGLLNDSCVGATWNLSSDIPQVFECPFGQLLLIVRYMTCRFKVWIIPKTECSAGSIAVGCRGCVDRRVPADRTG